MFECAKSHIELFLDGKGITMIVLVLTNYEMMNSILLKQSIWERTSRHKYVF